MSVSGCHPGYVDSLLEARDPYVGGSSTELAVLVEAKLRAFLETTGIERTTFRELAGRIGRNDRACNRSRNTEEPWQPAIWTLPDSLFKIPHIAILLFRPYVVLQ